jgi:DNA-binding response OmpR family regulator
VLVVEDEFLIAMDLVQLLEDHGWEVLGPVGTVEDGLRILDVERPAAALLDVHLRDGTVREVAEALRARNVPFIVASAFSRPEVFAGEILAGAPNVGKPVGEHLLLSLLDELVGS